MNTDTNNGPKSTITIHSHQGKKVRYRYLPNERNEPLHGKYEKCQLNDGDGVWTFTVSEYSFGSLLKEEYVIRTIHKDDLPNDFGNINFNGKVWYYFEEK
jgi:hypothetical protein